MTTAVLLDTQVYTRCYHQHHGRSDDQARGWLDSLTGRRVVICFQTRAEVLQGGLFNGWSEERLLATRQQLDAVPCVIPTKTVIDAYIELTANCRLAGHALHQKVHTGDRWIAACAMTHDIPLLSDDHIFHGAPGVSLYASA